MSTGYWDINSQSDYYNDNVYGSYQYQELNELISTFIAYYVGENKIIPKASKEDIAFFARRAAQELSYDTLRSKETWEFEVDNTAKTVFPHNFVGYTDVFWSSPNGIKRPLYPTRHTQNPFRPTVSTDPYSQTIETTTTTVPITQEPEVIPSNTKVYVFYDGTSMGVEMVQDAYASITTWIDTIEGYTREEDKTKPGQNVYHTIVSGERWLDWASVPMTGKFDNRQIFTENNIASTSPLSPNATNAEGNPTGTTDELFRFSHTQASSPDSPNDFLFSTGDGNANLVSYWSAQAANPTLGNQFYDSAQPNGTNNGGIDAGDTIATTSGNYVTQGAPPMAGPNDNVLVIIFADEAHVAYHGASSGVFDFNANGDGATDRYFGVDPVAIVQPTSIYKEDYNEYKDNYNAHTGNYNVFVYPKEAKVSGSFNFGKQRKQYLPHILAAISSGNQTKHGLDGTWKKGTSPTFESLADNFDYDLDLLEIEEDNVVIYDDATPNPNPYWNGMNPEFGGLDQLGFGTNLTGGELSVGKFDEDLNEFIASVIVTPDPEFETYTTEVISESGQNYWEINDDGTVAGSYGGTTHENFMNSNAGEPIIADADYDHGYENITLGQRFGISPEQAQVNGSYFMDYKNGCIFFSPSLIGQTVVLDYISDGLDSSGNMLIHKFAEEAFYKHVAYAIVSTGSNYSPATVQMLKKEKFATTRNAKIRLSNLKTVEMEQVMRNKSKWIKH